MRMGDAGTNLDPGDDFDYNLYRHPERWHKPSLRFERYHDLYALVSTFHLPSSDYS